VAVETESGQGAAELEQQVQNEGEGEGGQPNAGQPIEGETPPEIEALAKEMGWTPRDQFSGPSEAWKDARQFIRDGRDIQRETSRELKNLRGQLDTITRTTSTLIDQQVSERVAMLQQRHAALVEEGDSAGALRVAEEITRAKTIPQTINARGPSPEASDFAQRNPWLGKPGNEYATSRAVEICNTLAGQGYGHADQLRICEQRMRQEMPQLFGQGMNGHQPQRQAAAVHQPNARGPSLRSGPRGFADLPKPAQDIALDLERNNGVPKETYAKNYFANEERKA
jgi:hypothetical protein